MFGRRESLKELIRSGQRESREFHEEFRVYAEESRVALREFREFNREILLRNEKVYTGVIRRMEEMSAETRANTEETRANTEETRAQTKALLKAIDRMDRLDGTAPA